MDVSMSMSIIECCECHIQFAVSAEHAQALKRCHTTFYCPNGHGQSYVVKSDIERMREERDKARDELEKLKKTKCKKVKRRQNEY